VIARLEELSVVLAAGVEDPEAARLRKLAANVRLV